MTDKKISSLEVAKTIMPDDTMLLDDFSGSDIKYKYTEDVLMAEIMAYINSTYTSKENSHYAKSKVETTEVIIDNGFGYAFCMGNVLKYAQRYGKKQGYNRKDLLKVIHYAIMCLHIHDNEAENDCFIEEDKRTG